MDITNCICLALAGGILCFAVGQPDEEASPQLIQFLSPLARALPALEGWHERVQGAKEEQTRASRTKARLDQIRDALVIVKAQAKAASELRGMLEEEGLPDHHRERLQEQLEELSALTHSDEAP